VILRPAEATEYLQSNRLDSYETFTLQVTAREFDELYLSVKELRGRRKWVEPFSPDDELNAFLREVVRADLQMRFIETFPPVNETGWEIELLSRREVRNTTIRRQANGGRKIRLRQTQNKPARPDTGLPEDPESLLSLP